MSFHHPVYTHTHSEMNGERDVRPKRHTHQHQSEEGQRGGGEGGRGGKQGRREQMNKGEIDRERG